MIAQEELKSRSHNFGLDTSLKHNIKYLNFYASQIFNTSGSI